MKVCLIAVEIFAWGKNGGFGRSTRMIGRELARRGVEVTAVVPRRADQRKVEMLDGIRVLGFEPHQPISALKLFREADADIYHSQEPSFGTYLAKRAMPDRKHVVTFRDTRDFYDRWIEFTNPSLNYLKALASSFYEDNFLVHNAVRSADRWFTASKMLIPKARKKYQLGEDPQFLASPIPFAESAQKSERPLVCFVARLDRIKRPHIFFELAGQFPEVDFVAVGAGQNSSFESQLRMRYASLPNLELRGFVDQFDGSELSDLLSKSWILVNTSLKEALPTSFVEAAGHGCAILSELDPDGFSSNFGYYITDGDYAAGLRALLRDGSWMEKGSLGREYCREVFAVDTSIKNHLKIYESLLAK
ncbi:MAG: glycosyltransferase family 4 protein [Chloroflexi bacterium]|nr:glycosyltransferase family 4 protein [Chloroflexota bacterium]